MSKRALSLLVQKIRRCQRCRRPEGSYPVFAPLFPAKVMLIGQAPGREETKKGVPFIGKAGRRLFQWLKEAGIKEEEFRKRVYITQVVKCFFGKGKRGDIKPNKAIIDACFPYLREEIKRLDPEILIPVGALAIEKVLGKGKLVSFVGKRFRVELFARKRFVIPLPHPSGVSVWTYKKENRSRLRKAIGLIKSLFSPPVPG